MTDDKVKENGDNVTKEKIKALGMKIDSDVVMLHINEVRELQSKIEEYLNLAKRIQADFINYQNRVKGEKTALTKYAIEEFIKELLPALDCLSKFVDTYSGNKEMVCVIDGVKLVEKELLRILSKNGVKPIEIDSKEFNPLYHEAVAICETNDYPDMTILTEAQKGYMIHDRVLRPTQVRISKRVREKEDNKK